MRIFLRFGILVIIVQLFTGCTKQNPHHPLWRELDAPGGKLRVEFDDPPVYGSHTLYFWYVQGSSQKLLGSRELNNDGANLDDSNLVVVERGDSVMRFVLHGQQQRDSTVVLRVLRDGEVVLE